MEGMFYSARAFNQPLNAWDVATPRGRVFLLARVDRRRPSALFDRSTLARATVATSAPTSRPSQVSRVTTMEYMFFSADAFNQPLNDWDVAPPRGRVLLLGKLDRRRPSVLFD